MLPYIIQQLFEKKYLVKEYWSGKTFYVNVFVKFRDFIFGFFLLMFVVFVILLAVSENGMDTWTIVNKDTGERYEYARYYNTNDNDVWVECPKNPKPIYSYKNPKESNSNELDGVLFLKVDGKDIVIKNWEKINFRNVNQGDYCKNRPVIREYVNN